MLAKIRKYFQRRFKHQRDRRILMAAISAFLSKFGGAALQLFSIPLVVKTLGVQDFSIFAIASSIIVFMMFSNLGISGYIITAITAAKNNKDKLGEVAAIMATSLCITLVSAIAFLLLANIYSITIGLGSFFGGMYLYAPETVTKVFYLVLIFGAAQSVLTIFVAAQNGYQELHFSNLYGGCGNLFSALTIISYYFLAEDKKVLGYLLALYLPMIVCQAINAGHFLVRHPEARPKYKHVNGSLLVGALCSGGAFFVAQTALPVSIWELPKILMASTGNLAQVTTYALLMAIWVMLYGIISAFTQPLFGAISDAWANGEIRWVLNRLVFFVLLYVLVGTGLMIVGHLYGYELTALWVGVDAAIENSTMLVFGLLFGLAGILNLFIITIYAINLKIQCMIISLVTTICVCLALFLLGQAISVVSTLAMISIVIAFVGIPLAVILILLSYRKSVLDFHRSYEIF